MVQASTQRNGFDLLYCGDITSLVILMLITQHVEDLFCGFDQRIGIAQAVVARVSMFDTDESRRAMDRIFFQDTAPQVPVT